jgi:hypothetical protein
MIGAFARKLFGSANERVVKGLRRQVDAINALEPKLVGLSDAATGWPMARPWTTSWSMPLPPCARPPSGRWGSVTSTSS